MFRHDREPDNISRVEPSNPVVRRFVAALNAGDRPAFFAVLTSDATMSDDGAHGDGLALDGVYGALLPAQPDGTVVEFYVEAVDASNKTNSWPRPALPS